MAPPRHIFTKGCFFNKPHGVSWFSFSTLPIDSRSGFFFSGLDWENIADEMEDVPSLSPAPARATISFLEMGFDSGMCNDIDDKFVRVSDRDLLLKDEVFSDIDEGSVFASLTWPLGSVFDRLVCFLNILLVRSVGLLFAEGLSFLR